MDTLKRMLEPLTRNLSPRARAFLDNGGYWLIVAFLALVALLVLMIAIRLLKRAFGGRRRAGRNFQSDLTIDLDDCPLPRGPRGKERLSVNNVPARLRLVVLAPAGKEYRVDPGGLGLILDRIVPGLAAVAIADQPRILIWPPQLSYQGFANTFHRCTPLDTDEGEPSQWMILAGRAQMGKTPVLLGLGLWTDEATVFGRRTLAGHEWPEVLRVRRKES